jgi:hypothetical protein
MLRSVRKIQSRSINSSWPENKLILVSFAKNQIGQTKNFSQSNPNFSQSNPNFSQSNSKQQQKIDPSFDSKSGSGIFLKIFGSSLLIFAVPIGFAFYDPKFRAKLESYLPFMKPFFGTFSSRSEEKPKSNENLSISSLSRPKENDKKKLVEIPKKNVDENKTEKAKPEISSGISSGISPQIKVEAKAAAEAENAELRKEISAAKNKITDLEGKVKNLEANQAETEKTAQESSLAIDLVGLLEDRVLSEDEKKLVEAVIASTTERLENDFDRFIEEL